MDTLQLYFLGPLDIRSSDRQLAKPPTLKSQSLLAYLVFNRSQPQPRDHLAGIFFSERNEHKARRSLSTALWHIRRCLPNESILLYDAHTVQFDPRSPFWLDVDEFEALASRSDAASLHSAVTLYRGDFLDGFYDDWIISERYRLESLYLEALARLMVTYEAGKDYQAALAAALRLLNRDSLREDAYQVAMRAFCHLGQRKAALEQYERCRETVLKELGAEPMLETRELYQSILTGSLEVGPQPAILPMASRPSESAVRHPLDITATVSLVGREEETSFLEDCWHTAQTGRGCLALIRGEAGVGKTRLVNAFANRLRWQNIQVLWGRCYEFERAMPYQPVADALNTFLPTIPNNKLAELPAWVLNEISRLVPDLRECSYLRDFQAEMRRKGAAAPGPALPSVSNLDPKQTLLFRGVTHFLEELSARGALLVVLEDLHWASESTLQLLHHLVRQLASHQVLIVGTFRPEAAGLEHLLRALHRQLAVEGLARQLELPRLSPADVEKIIVEMSGADAAVTPLAKRLYQETEGNPFFLMETIKALFETNIIRITGGVWQGDFARISQAEFPLSSNVSEAIQARVQRLGENARDGLCLAAVLGREFNDEVFHMAWGKGEEAALEMLDELLRHRLIEEKDIPNDNDFAFTHHKIQEVVYQSLARHRCLHLHARVGTAMETIYTAELDTRAGELAHHFEQACRIDRSLSGKAIRYLLRAGQQAVRQFAYQEAVTYYQRGMAVLLTQPETEQQMHQEIELQLALAVPIMAIYGYASPQTKHVYDRTQYLCQKLGETPELFTALVGLARYYGVTGEIETALKLGEQILAIALKTGDTDFLVEAYREKGNNMLLIPRLKESCAFYKRSITLYDLSMHERNVSRFGHDAIVTCLGFLSFTLWILGYPEQSLVESRNLSKMIPSFTHPPSQAYAYCQLAMHAYLRAETKACLDHAEAAVYLAQYHELPIWMALATTLKGWALVMLGEVKEGEALLKEGVKAWRATGFLHLRSFLLALQVEACLQLQKLDDGMAAVAAALAIIQSGMDPYWGSELYRLRGELVRAQGKDLQCAEIHFRQAIEMARKHETRMLELRAATSLGRLWLDQGQPHEAHQLLAEVCEQFTEGFDTCELKAASELRKELA